MTLSIEIVQTGTESNRKDIRIDSRDRDIFWHIFSAHKQQQQKNIFHYCVFFFV
jgi:hypothetical protein